MEFLRKEPKLCLCCMTEHDVATVRVREKNIFMGEEIEYDAIYEYCAETDEYVASDEEILINNISMKNAYRMKMGLLTSDEIENIRQKYEISQSDFEIILDWECGAIAHYESHKIQDKSHDKTLRMINENPGIYVSMLKKSKERLSLENYTKYLNVAEQLM